MKDKQKKGVGRPTKYKEEFAEQGKRLALLGMTNEQLAKYFDVCVSSIDKWLRDIPEFSSAIKSGREDADAMVVNSLYNKAIGYMHPERSTVKDGETVVESERYYPPDTVAQIFWLKNRQRAKWRDKAETSLNASASFEDENGKRTKYTIEFINADDDVSQGTDEDA